MTEAVLELKDVCFRWSNQDRATIDLPELKIDQGERIFLQGPSGSGKSTLLSLVGGILVAESGSLRVLGEELKGLSRARRDAFRVTHLGFIFQLFNLLPYLSLEENVLLPLRFSKKRAQRAGSNQAERLEEAQRLLTALGLSEPLKEGRPVVELSVGQQQRVAAARALICLHATNLTPASGEGVRARFWSGCGVLQDWDGFHHQGCVPEPHRHP